MFRHQQQAYPSLKLIPVDEELYHRGVMANRKFESDALRKLYRERTRDGRVPSQIAAPDKVIIGTLHEALDGYVKHIEPSGLKLEDGTLKPSQRKRLSYIKTLREHHRDHPLHEITFDRIAAMYGHWTNRPKNRRETRYKPSAARHNLKELERFLRWLDATSEFNGEMPRGVEQINRKIGLNLFGSSNSI